jgi:hypothetical protein
MGPILSSIKVQYEYQTLHTCKQRKKAFTCCFQEFAMQTWDIGIDYRPKIDGIVKKMK